MDLIPMTDDRRLYLSPDIEDWQAIHAAGISTVIDVDAGVDAGLPTTPDEILYVYFPFTDDALPDRKRLHAVGKLGADLIKAGHTVLVHCAMGFNRSALVAGVILKYLGITGQAVLDHIRDRRPGALYNKKYAEYLESGAPL